MKKYLILLLVPLLGWSMTAGAQRLGVREEVRADWNSCFSFRSWVGA